MAGPQRWTLRARIFGSLRALLFGIHERHFCSFVETLNDQLALRAPDYLHFMRLEPRTISYIDHRLAVFIEHRLRGNVESAFRLVAENNHLRRDTRAKQFRGFVELEAGVELAH